MFDVTPLVALEMKSRGIDNYKLTLEQVFVNEPDTILNLNKYIYLFASTSVDTPALPTRITLQSPDNIFQFTKTTLENTHITQHQFFSEELQIMVENYGSDKPSDFIPFMLEFYKVVPLLEDKTDEKKE